MRRLIFGVLLFGLCASVIAKEIPIESFAKKRKYEDVQISPTGDYLAVEMHDENSRRVIAVLRTSDMELVSYLPPAGGTEPVNPVWVTDNSFISQLSITHGDLESPRLNGELVIMNADGSGRKMLTQNRRELLTSNRDRGPKNNLQGYSEVIHNLPSKPDKVLIKYFEFATTRRDKTPKVYELNINDGRVRRIAVAPSYWGEFILSPEGEITHSVGTDKDTFDVVVHSFVEKKWELTGRLSQHEEGTVPIASTLGAEEIILAEKSKDGPEKLYRYDLKGRKKKLIYSHGRVDHRGFLRDPVTGKPLAIHFEPGYPDVALLDSSHPITQAYVSLFHAFGGQRVEIISGSRDGRKLVIKVTADNEPGQFHLYDAESKELRYILASKPWLQGESLARSEAVEFEASDGRKIAGFLTRSEGGKGLLPLVVKPHGGPHGVRDYWEYDDDVQMLASRGFAVLQVNFRGSAGYGNAFETAGFHQWGDRVQKDIIEATRWAIESRNIDPDRICIFGASFGGYSALMSPILAPDLFRCAIGFAGVYDLELMWSDGDMPEYGSVLDYLEDAVGRDPTELARYSPARNAQKITVPVLLIHGREDERAPISQFDQMRRALRKAEKPVESLVVKGEGHGFYLLENRVAAYRKVLAFLESHIGERAP
ncbi:Dipeptidyl aminopeptidase/acylaminoacyl peptidase [Microbulbifer donghaiensis]|uniref:Dipeptidyl aminopeptidase/acylaminoacyl peptidase n=1 Tax=Microbulbifer donghaiensis TaxID=494016 RepID=A0A1M4Y709_9GAMM|nr:S9 family peptidase [Microbulbifer donghaiensis]SHF01242.1 Dipeptidyl aminopeptidase/acylaminoacyl peptidase [Microbulbifer donghaiensis]